MLHSKDEVDLHRSQGAIGILDAVLTLEDDLRRYEQDVLNKVVQPIKEGEVQNAVV